MAISLATASDYLKRTTALLPANADSTVAFWFRTPTVATSPDSQVPYVILDDPGVYTDYLAVYSDTVSLKLEGTGPLDANGTALPNNRWIYCAWVQSGTQQQLWLNGFFTGAFTLNRAAFTDGFELMGSDTLTTVGGVQIAYVREWTAALTGDQLKAEMNSTTVVTTTALWMNCPMTSDAVDISGNGHSWTTMGSATFVAGPTLAANSTITTAIDLGVPPKTLTLDFGSGSEAWYSYTPAHDTEVVLGFWAFYDFTKVDDLLISVYQGPTGAPSLWPNVTNGIDGSSSVPYQIPVTFGTTIYIKLFAHNAAALPFGNTIQITTLPGPTEDVPVGAIAVNDDLNGFPLALLNQTTGKALNFVQLAAGGSGVIMTDGLILLDDTFNAQFVAYQNTIDGYIQQWTLPYLHGAVTANIGVVGTDGSTLFYILTNNVAGTAKVDTVNRSGAVVSTFTLANGIRTAAPNQDNTILYYVLSGLNKSVKRWDLVNNIALSDLIVGIAGYQNSIDIVVLADGTVINGYVRTSPSDTIIKHISAAGVVLDTYTSFLSSGVTTTTLDHMCSAIDDPVSFWTWFHNDTNAPYSSTFYEITVSGGAKTAIDATQYEQGQYGGDFTAPPTDRFGHSNSCPFWINRVGISPSPPSPNPTANEYLIRRERWFPHLNQEQFRQFFSFLQIDLQAGNGLITGQGSDPLMEIDWSDDGGWTWSSIRFVTTGKIGAYTHRAIVRRLGYSRDRVFRIAVSDPVQWIVINGYVQAVLGSS